MPGAAAMRERLGGLRARAAGWLPLGSLAGAALAIVATLFDPTLPMQRARVEQVIVLDVTQSMNVPDEMHDGRPVSRLDAAKFALRDALRELPCGSKIGWGLFTEYRSYLLLVPMEVCANRAELLATLAQIDGRMAWSGNSEVAKGLHSGIVIAKELPGVPALVFVTDGHEAPPLNPRHRPRFDDKPGEVQGLIVGVGGLQPARIPKTDALGRPLGFWRADDVLQVDPRAKGRGASVSGETMADAEGGDASGAARLGTTPGSEHLSSLREGYLQLLASEQGLAFHRLRGSHELAEALTRPAMSRPLSVSVDMRAVLAALAIGLLAWPYLGGLRRRRRKPA